MTLKLDFSCHEEKRSNIIDCETYSVYIQYIVKSTYTTKYFLNGLRSFVENCAPLADHKIVAYFNQFQELY